MQFQLKICDLSQSDSSIRISLENLATEWKRPETFGSRLLNRYLNYLNSLTHLTQGNEIQYLKFNSVMNTLFNFLRCQLWTNWKNAEKIMVVYREKDGVYCENKLYI